MVRASGSAEPGLKLPSRLRREFAPRLLAWNAVHGRSHLPWQNTRDPYRVWLSEIMLQQTTVAAVGRYYREFLKRWPNVRRLAEAPLDDVLGAEVADESVDQGLSCGTEQGARRDRRGGEIAVCFGKQRVTDNGRNRIGEAVEIDLGERNLGQGCELGRGGASYGLLDRWL